MPTRTSRIASSSAETFGTGAYTSASFTPNNNSLLVAIGFAIEETDTGLEGTSLTITDSAGLTWTSRAATTTSPAWSYGIRIWTAPVTTGTSMTVSLDAGAFNVHQYRLVVVDYTSYDTGTPVGATAIGSDADGDGAASITLSASPLSDAEVIAACLTGVNAGSGSVTPGTGWTEIDDSATANWTVYQVQTRTSSTSTSVDWNDVLASGTPFGGATLAAIEIRHVPAAGGQPPRSGHQYTLRRAA